jgi:hypothetical protein
VLLLPALLLPHVAPQLSSELGLASPGVVEVDGVGWLGGDKYRVSLLCVTFVALEGNWVSDQPGHVRTKKTGRHCSRCCSRYDGGL